MIETAPESALERLYQKARAQRRLNDAEEVLFRRTATHEAGHLLVARYYDLGPNVFIGGIREGICTHRASKDNPTITAAVSWGGIVAEAMLDTVNTDARRPAMPLDLYVWPMEYLRGGYAAKLSRPDREGLLIDNSSSESFRAAFNILAFTPGLVEHCAGLLMEDFRPFVVDSLDDSDGGASRVEAWLAHQQGRRGV